MSAKAKDWRATVDKNTGRTYYYNKKTKETTWVMPDVMKAKLLEDSVSNSPQAAKKPQNDEPPAEPVAQESSSSSSASAALSSDLPPGFGEEVEDELPSQSTPFRSKPFSRGDMPPDPSLDGPPEPDTSDLPPGMEPEEDEVKQEKEEKDLAGAAQAMALPPIEPEPEEREEYRAPVLGDELELPSAPGAGAEADLVDNGTCTACSKTINGPAMTISGKGKFHGDCLKCELGGCSLAPSFEYHLHEGKIYCPKHFVTLFEKDCTVCKKKIPGKYITVQENYMHPECWTCKTCSKVLSPEDHGVYQMEFYCKDCHQKAVQEGGDDDAKAQAAYARLQEKLAAAKARKNQKVVKEERKLKPGETFTLEELQGAGKDLPVDLDRRVKEDYLSDQEFASLMQMSRDEFRKIPKWKRDGIKKKLNIF